MAEFDPDEFLRKYGGDEVPPSAPAERPLTGSPFSRAVVGASRGFIKGVEETTDKAASYLPWSAASKGIPEIPPSQNTAGSVGRFAGSIAPTFAIPGFGIASGVARTVPGTLGRIAGTALETGVQGTLGGALAPGDSTSNTQVGGIAGAALGTGKEATALIPPKYRWLLSLVPGAVAVEILHRMGAINAWTTYPVVAGIGSGLGALAAKAAGKVPAATAGNIAARVRPAEDDTDGR